MAKTTLIYNNLLELMNDGALPNIVAASALGILLIEVADDGTTTAQRSRLNVAAILGSAAVELSSTGYTREFLTGVAVVRDDTGNVVEVTADDVDFGALTQAAAENIVGAVVYLEDAVDADRIPLWGVTADGGDVVTPNGEAFYLRFEGSVGGLDGVLWRTGQGTL